MGGEEGRSGTKEMESARNKLAKKEISYRKKDMKINDMESLTHVLCMREGEKEGGEMERDIWEAYGKGWN